MKRISAREAVGLDGSSAIVDVREDDEYAAVHVVGSLSIPLSCFVDRIDQVPLGAPVYVICASGNRSAKVTEYLSARDYDATNIDGGIIGWASCGGPTASGAPSAIELHTVRE
ncbi:MAG: rhodanese-like domain-containing protein [Lacisediminihabitans sp.]